MREGLIETARKGCEGAYERRRVTLNVNDPRNDWLELLEPMMKSGRARGEARPQLALL